MIRNATEWVRNMTNEYDKAMKCPICNRNNSCGNPEGKSDMACWCGKETFPNGIFELIPADQLNKSCLCKECLEHYKVKN